MTVSVASLDALLNHISSNVTDLHLVTGAEPETRTAAIAGSVATTPFDSADCTLENYVVSGEVMGKQHRYAAKSALSRTALGNTNWIALISGTELLVLAPIPTPIGGNIGDSLDVAEWIHREPAT